MEIPPNGSYRYSGTQRQARTHAAEKSASGEVVVPEAAALNCVECHMPLVQRPLAPCARYGGMCGAVITTQTWSDAA